MGCFVCVLNVCLHGNCYYGLVFLFVLWLSLFSFSCPYHVCSSSTSSVHSTVSSMCCITLQEYCFAFSGCSALYSVFSVPNLWIVCTLICLCCICSIFNHHIFSLLMFRLHLIFLFLLYLLQLFLHCELHTVKHRKGELKDPPFLLLMVLLNLFAHSFSLI